MLENSHSKPLCVVCGSPTKGVPVHAECVGNGMVAGVKFVTQLAESIASMVVSMRKK